MKTMMTENLNHEAVALLGRALEGWDDTYGAGHMSCAVYDTAWVSLVAKTVDGQRQWLFPEAFQYLLDSQAEDGSWGKNDASEVDGILNTAASLLSLQRHAAEPLTCASSHDDASLDDSSDLARRIDKATQSLHAQLQTWRVSTTAHVGFEMIVPALLKYLVQQDPRLSFDFSGQSRLEYLHAQKLSRFKPKMLYGTTKSTILHSLEALVGIVDFDQVAHHTINGSMMASPSSTAAYLINISGWDDEAEAYLRHVIKCGAGHGDGSVPSAFPSMHFEYSWILSTLFQAGFSPADLAGPELTQMEKILVTGFEEDGGTLGFAPRLGADVDDTAKGMVSLLKLGHDIPPQRMIEEFESDTHFKTYALERDPSFTANCNAMLALLDQPQVSHFSRQIIKVTTFLCDCWWSSDNKIQDKWNVCSLYPSYLLVEAFVKLLALVDQASLTLDPDLLSRVAISLTQASNRTLLTQADNGSWSDTVEVTAYGILILSEARRVAVFRTLLEPLDTAIRRAVEFIQSAEVHTPARIWIEKVNYSSPHLSTCYALAALKAAATPSEPTVGRSFSNDQSTSTMDKHIALFRLTPLFTKLPPWQLRCSTIEAALFQPLLRRRRLAVFPRRGMAEDKYFDIIPLTWTACNNRRGTFAPTSFLFDMMVISFLNYQADEFMESVAGRVYSGREDRLRHIIDHITTSGDLDCTGGAIDTGKGSQPGDTPPILHTDDDHVAETLSRFVAHITNHPAVTFASKWDRDSTIAELRRFLHAHVTQSIDNARLESQPHRIISSSAADSFFQWVRTISADHTSCPYSFSFVSCLLSSMNGGHDTFSTAGEKYLGSAICRHLATMCRMYNDYGSISRDEAECNLNSINFPEFHTTTTTTLVNGKSNHHRQDSATSTNTLTTENKAALFSIAEYERSCLETALTRLADETARTCQENSELRLVKERQAAVWRMFCDVTDLYGQIYVVKDIASRMGG